MKNYRFICIVLALVMVLGLAACGTTAAPEAAPVPVEQTAEPAGSYEGTVPVLSDVDTQLTLIHAAVGQLLQAEGSQPWYYTVTDLDHNGSLEFIAASQHPEDRSTNLKIWEVSKDRTSLVERNVEKDPEESFPDIMTDSADTYHDAASDTWFYMFYDNVVISDTEVYTSKSAFNFKDGVISYKAFAVEHTVVENGGRVVTYTDAEGNTIIAEVYLESGKEAFTGAERSNTGFEWLTVNEAKDFSRLVESYSVFMGERKPTENFPVPAPVAFSYPESQGPAVTPAPTATPAPSATPAPTPTPDPGPTYLVITKNPTNENRNIGSTARFVACANAFDSLEWVLVAPNGDRFTPIDFAAKFSGSSVRGYYTTTIAIENVSADMDGWGAYCVFRYRGQVASTSTAYILIKNAPAPTPTPEPVYEEISFDGYVCDFGYDYVTVRVEGVDYFTVSKDKCRFALGSGNEIYIGAPATIYCPGGTARKPEVNSCLIFGRDPAPAPVEACTNAQVFKEPDGRLQLGFIDGSNIYLPAPTVGNYGLQVYGGDASQIPLAGGGAKGSVYYRGDLTAENIYLLEVYLFLDNDPEPESEPEPEPEPEPESEPEPASEPAPEPASESEPVADVSDGGESNG